MRRYWSICTRNFGGKQVLNICLILNTVYFVLDWTYEGVLCCDKPIQVLQYSLLVTKFLHIVITMAHFSDKGKRRGDATK